MTSKGQGVLLRVVTYNFLRGGSRKRSGHLARVFREFNPDIVLCQEWRPDHSPAQNGNENSAFGNFFWRPARGNYWGTGLLVRGLKASEIRVPGFHGWVLGAELQLDRRLCIFSVHCPAGRGGYAKVVHRILDRIRKLGKDADVIIGGDFNVAAGYRFEGDVIKFTRAERAVLDRITHELGLIPAWQAANPGRPLAQTLRWTMNRSTPYHCDGIFIPARWGSGLRVCKIAADAEWERLSDHNPVWAELEVTT
ncbi:MAG TPA: endonuclease/exonuclease/phosphatase family protein [Longimicrobiales bacterium]|nr:endonuclease/exonuclease/phosphatase family protein [Longimicrobiales bacterium]